MIETQCLVNGKRLKLKYSKQFNGGDSFKGFIFSTSVIPFSFHALRERFIQFEPESLDEGLKLAIYKAIKNDQLRQRRTQQK